MNFYASQDYLNAVAEVYFKGRRTSISDVRIGEHVLRLLVVDDTRIITSIQFLDYHEPLLETEIHLPMREFGFARSVAHRIIKQEEWEPGVFQGFDLAPYVDWSIFREFNDFRRFILARNKGLVRERERRGRRLADTFGKPVFRFDDDQEDVLECARRWKSRQLRETGQKDYIADPRTLEFLNLLRQKRLLTASTLRVSGRLISIWVGFVHDRVWSGWIFTYDPDFRKYSAGHQLVNLMLEESFRLKHREFDFSIGSENYKMLYATHGRILGSIGSAPLHERFLASTRSTMKMRSPALFEAARAVKKKALKSRMFLSRFVESTSKNSA